MGSGGLPDPSPRALARARTSVRTGRCPGARRYPYPMSPRPETAAETAERIKAERAARRQRAAARSEAAYAYEEALAQEQQARTAYQDAWEAYLTARDAYDVARQHTRQARLHMRREAP